jgi:hypothetical protein
MYCFDFAGWCGSIGSYCSAGGSGGGQCSKSDCFKGSPPSGGKAPTTTTSVYPCKASTTTAKPTTTTTRATCVPAPTGICTQPSSGQWGYGPGFPIGGIELPIVTCNDLQSDFSVCPFKLYNSTETSKCGRYQRNELPSACSDACRTQYDQCSNTYAQGCKGNTGASDSSFNWWWKRRAEGEDDDTAGVKGRGTDYFSFARASPGEKRSITWTDTYGVATNKCQAQYQDCLNINAGVSGTGKCSTWGVGH